MKLVFLLKKSLAIRAASVKSHFGHWGHSMSFERENSKKNPLTNNNIPRHFLKHERLLMKVYPKHQAANYELIDEYLLSAVIILAF